MPDDQDDADAPARLQLRVFGTVQLFWTPPLWTPPPEYTSLPRCRRPSHPPGSGRAHAPGPAVRDLTGETQRSSHAVRSERTVDRRRTDRQITCLRVVADSPATCRLFCQQPCGRFISYSYLAGKIQPVTAASNPLGKVLPRRASVILEDALSDTRVVLITGARQGGKSTLAGLLARGRSATWRTLDSSSHRSSAVADPDGFVDADELMVIDAIQRVPELLLAIKQQVDTDERPGRYLLTGSAKILGLRGLPDTLPGRTETVELWPFSQGEIDGRPDGFVDAAFDLGPELDHSSTITRAEYIERDRPRWFSGGGSPVQPTSPGAVL